MAGSLTTYIFIFASGEDVGSRQHVRTRPSRVYTRRLEAVIDP